MKGRVGRPQFLKASALTESGPSRVTITKADGTVTTVDPVTRTERDSKGRILRVVPPSGFNAPIHSSSGCALPSKAQRQLDGAFYPSYGSSLDVDPGVLAPTSYRRKVRVV